MSTIQNLFQQAQLAEAAYADFSVLGVSTKDALIAEKFSPAQATAFVAEWQVIDQIPDTASGFSATIFKNIKVGSADFGKYTVAMRGTAGVVDLGADAGDVFADGIALDQTVDMYNYWTQLKTPAGQSYQAATTTWRAAGQRHPARWQRHRTYRIDKT